MDNEQYLICKFGVCYLSSFDRVFSQDVKDEWYPVTQMTTKELEAKRFDAATAKTVASYIGGDWYQANATYTKVDPSTLGGA